MRWCVGLLGTISSISFAQIAKDTRTHLLTQHLYQNNAHYTGYYPQFIPRQSFGISQTQLITNTDIQESRVWYLWANTQHQHQTSFFKHGTSDWGFIQLSHHQFLKINPKWALGSSLDLQINNPNTAWSLQGFAYSLWKIRPNKHIRYGLTLHPFFNQHEIGYHEQQEDFAWGAFITKKGDPYHLGIYIETKLHEEVPLMLYLGSGAQRLGVFVCAHLNQWKIQIGGLWLSPLNQMQLQIQLQYDRQTRGNGIDGRGRLSFNKSSNE